MSELKHPLAAGALARALARLHTSGVRGGRPAERAGGLGAALADDGLFGRFGYLLVSQALQLLFGLGYWSVTARLAGASSVGVAAAAVSVATLLSAVGILGIGSVMLVELAATPEEEAPLMVTTGGVLAGGIVGLLAVCCWAAASLLGPSMREISHSVPDGGLFVIGSVLLAAASVFDTASIGLHRARAQLLRNAVQAGLRFAVVTVVLVTNLGHRSATVLLSVWVLSLAVSLALGPRFLRLGHGGFALELARRRALVVHYARLSLNHHALNLAIGSIGVALSFIAALLVVPEQLAYFSVAQLVASSVMLPPALLAMTLFAETTGDRELLRRSIRKTIPVGAACCFLALAVVEPAAHLVLSLFRSSYADHGTTVLRILLLGGIPYVVKDHYVSIRRAERRLAEAARVVAVATGVEVVSAAIGGVAFGLTGLCAGWVIGAAAEAAYFAPIVFSTAYGSAEEPRGLGAERLDAFRARRRQPRPEGALRTVVHGDSTGATTTRLVAPPVDGESIGGHFAGPIVVPPFLPGQLVCLEALAPSHLEDLVAAAGGDRSAYDFTAVPQGRRAMAKYLAAQLAERERGNLVPFAQLRREDGRAVGATAFLNLRREAGAASPYAVEIGWSWLAPEAIGTGINLEAKFLLLSFAFEHWGVQRVDLKTDARNERSRRAIAGLGASFEGVLRSWQPSLALGEVGQLRDTAMYSLVESEWLQARAAIRERLLPYLLPRGVPAGAPGGRVDHPGE